jgi:predicted nucleic acid-binding protein
MKVIDSTVAIDHLRGLDPATDLIGCLVSAGDRVVASEVVRFELLAGVRREEVRAMDSLFSTITWMPVDEQVARTAAHLAEQYRRSHPGVDANDFVIGATALLLDAELLTTNVRHFPMFDGLIAPY